MSTRQDTIVVTLGLCLASSTIIGIEFNSAWLGLAAFMSHTAVMIGWKRI